MPLSGPSTTETHPGHREPCETFRRRQAESGNRLKKCDQEVKERWKHTDGPRKCKTCKTVTREEAKIRRTAKRKAKMAARKQDMQKKRRCQEHRIMASTTSIEAAEETDHYVNMLPPIQAQEYMIHQFNTLPPMQAQEPMMYQHTIVKTEPPPPPRYNERQTFEDIAWNSIPDTIAWEASLRHEAAQFQPKQTEQEAVAWNSIPHTIAREASLRHEAAQFQSKETEQEAVAWDSIPETIARETSLQHEAAQTHSAQPLREQEQGEAIKQERNSTTSPPSSIHHHYPPPPPSYPLCTCAPHRHQIDTIHECALKANELYDALFLDQFITNAFEYDPTWRTECGAVMSMREQGDVWRWFLGVVEGEF